MKTAVLDSYALIAYFQRQSGYEEVAALLGECAAKGCEVCISVVNWGEVIYHALRNGGERRAQLAEAAMEAIPIVVVEANKEFTMQAARLKAFRRLSYADCFAAALAMKKKGELVTGDKEFKTVEKEIKVRWI
jgi:ribonuclease VapC